MPDPETVEQVGDHLEWRGYVVRYCKMCKCLTFTCHDPACQAGYCSGGGCAKCRDDQEAFQLIERRERERWVYDPD